MIGSGVVSVPYAFESSGLLLGLIVCIVGVICSCRTCILIIRTSGSDTEYFETLYKYWGKWAYYLGAISTLLIFVAAVCSYVILMS